MNNEGYVICEECSGTGNIFKIKGLFKTQFKEICTRCYGEGKLTWVENILGKENPFVFSLNRAFSCSSIGFSEHKQIKKDIKICI